MEDSEFYSLDSGKINELKEFCLKTLTSIEDHRYGFHWSVSSFLPSTIQLYDSMNGLFIRLAEYLSKQNAQGSKSFSISEFLATQDDYINKPHCNYDEKPELMSLWKVDENIELTMKLLHDSYYTFLPDNFYQVIGEIETDRNFRDAFFKCSVADKLFLYEKLPGEELHELRARRKDTDEGNNEPSNKITLSFDYWIVCFMRRQILFADLLVSMDLEITLLFPWEIKKDYNMNSMPLRAGQKTSAEDFYVAVGFVETCLRNQMNLSDIKHSYVLLRIFSNKNININYVLDMIDYIHLDIQMKILYVKP